MEEQLESWLRELGEWLVVSTGDEQYDVLGMVSPYQPGKYSYPYGSTGGIVGDAGDQVIFLIPTPIEAAQVEQVICGETRYKAYCCTQITSLVYKARLQKEE